MAKPQKQAAALLLVAYAALPAFVAWRLWAAFLPPIPLAGYLAGYLLLCACLPAGFLLPHSKFSKGLCILGNYWVSLQIVLAFSALAEWVLTALTSRLFGNALSPLLPLLLYGAGLATFLYGVVHTRNIRVQTYRCPVDKPNIRGRQLRVVQLSDLHLGSINDLRAVQRIVHTVNGLSADIVCITGDTFTENTREVFELQEIATAFRAIKSRRGVFACLGNHDAGFELPNMLAFYRQAGVTLLKDTYLQRDGVTLLGRADRTPGENIRSHRASARECLQGSCGENLILAMDHQPGDLEGAAEAGVDILLSGHTHGGQFYPLNRLIQRVFPHYRGCKRVGTMYAIVSAGTCTPVPYVRAIGNSEIVVVEVTGR